LGYRSGVIFSNKSSLEVHRLLQVSDYGVRWLWRLLYVLATQKALH